MSAKKKSEVVYVAESRVNTRGWVTGNQYYLTKGDEVTAPPGEFDHIPTLVRPKNGV